MKKLEPIPLTKEFLIERGRCCSNKCSACPFDPKWTRGSTKILQK